MTSPRLNLIVIRSQEPARTVGFYELLGLNFQEEQHGKGPVHWAAELDGQVLEIYPAKTMQDVDSSTRLGFQIRSIEDVINSLRSKGAEIVQSPQTSDWGLRAVIRDPDGRSVELAEESVPSCSENQHVSIWIIDVINQIYMRPFMYVGSPTESHALDCVFYMMHAAWAEAVGKQSDYASARSQIAVEEEWNALGSSDWYLSQHPDAEDQEIFEYAMSCWKRLSMRLGILREKSH
jgi:predicted enzyme related to lactoylglutathione lyase